MTTNAVAMQALEPAAEIPDVQGSPDTRNIAIDKVGIKGIRHPVRVRDRSQGEQHTIATFNMYVELPHNFKGTHMSRFVAILNNHEYEITVKSFRDMLTEMTTLLEADAGHIEMTFPYFVRKASPVTGVTSLMDYEVTLVGRVTNGSPRIEVCVVVPVTSLCPCSKQISDYGAHNQRSPRDGAGDDTCMVVDRGADRHRGVRSLVRAVRAAQAARREVRHRTRVREPEIRRGHGARRRATVERRGADRPLRGRGRELRVDPQTTRPMPSSSGTRKARRSAIELAVGMTASASATDPRCRGSVASSRVPIPRRP